MKKRITLGLVLCLCMIMLAGCGKPLQESEVAKELVTAINEATLEIWKKEEYGFKERNRFMKEGQLHEVYESNGVSLDDVLYQTPDEEINLIKSSLEIISKDGELKKVIMNYNLNEKRDYSLTFSWTNICMEKLHPDFEYEENYEQDKLQTDFERTYYPKEKK